MIPTDPLRKALAVTATCLVFASPAQAYLDPGTGSIILQSILAGIAVAMGMLRLYWHQFKSFIANLTGKIRNQQSEENQKVGQEPDV